MLTISLNSTAVTYKSFSTTPSWWKRHIRHMYIYSPTIVDVQNVNVQSIPFPFKHLSWAKKLNNIMNAFIAMATSLRSLLNEWSNFFDYKWISYIYTKDLHVVCNKEERKVYIKYEIDVINLKEKKRWIGK